jgi:hypothetical protein
MAALSEVSGLGATVALADADVTESGDSIATAAEGGVEKSTRLSLASRFWSKANAMYCPVCGEELTFDNATPSSGNGRYCVEDHSRR